MNNTKMKNLRKMGGVIAFLAGVIAISGSASAINIIVEQRNSNFSDTSLNLGQSFINDPSGTGATIKLNSWTFRLADATSATAVLVRTLNIYLGTGNGGTLVGSSTTTASSSFAGGNSVQWTFAGGLNIIDNLTYSSVISGNSNIRVSAGNNPYANGVEVADTFTDPDSDLVFQGNFSAAAPVPFEFEASGGLAMLGAGWLLRRHLQKKKS